MATRSRLFGWVTDDSSALGDTVALIRRYFLQETLEPLKHLARAVAFYLVGALLLGIGSVFLLLALLRALETETGGAFGGNWTFAPYALVFLAALALVGVSIGVGIRRKNHATREGVGA